jgi:hypothetical protein
MFPRPASTLLDRRDVLDDLLEGRGHQLMHRRWIFSLDETRGVAVPIEQRAKLIARDACEHGRVGDLVPVEVQDGQYGTIARGIEELVRVPARGERACLGLTVPNHTHG